MIDTRCYNCIEKPDIFDIEVEPKNMQKYAEIEYQENGIFKCPKCGDIQDYSNKTYITIVQRKYDEFGEFETEILETDPKLIGDNKDGFEQDMYELDIFENLPVGIYKLDVLWYYYDCGGYEGAEWDVQIEILSEDNIEVDKFIDKQKHLRMWKDYNRDKIRTKMAEEIKSEEME